MVDIRHYTFAAITAILLAGTVYSLVYDTYLDTSDPLLAHLPHKLHATHYFASKRNPLNVYFIKRAWGWTTTVFVLSYATAPPAARTADRLRKYALLTLLWVLFTRWFFGPALLERVVVLSGGECTLALPAGGALTVPAAHCRTRTVLAPATHPALFAGDVSALGLADWSGVPRLRSGHDVSGHVYLLTQAALFLADQLRPAFRAGHRRWGTMHGWALAAHVVLLAVWLFALGTTGVYFHTPFEKVTGYGACCSVPMDATLTCCSAWRRCIPADAGGVRGRGADSPTRSAGIMRKETSYVTIYYIHMRANVSTSTNNDADVLILCP